jgi:hypothetical protein
VVEEIVYTSAEKGLKQGSRGFCTVVSTAGMSLALAERLESMSGYRHAFPLHDPQASLNPVCFSHVTTRLAGKSLHVISRVADAGQDYTGRSNKLAHHLVIDNVASMPAGPARLMAEPGVIVERWDGNVRNVPPRELRCAPLPASIPLVAWQSLTGDEGWAGSVAEQLLQNPAPVSIIFKPGTDTLTLVREVLDLIPAPQRWNVTFSTYFTRLLAGAECQLRFVLNDTPEATSLRNDARARVIDLTSSLPAATGGTLVAMARKGQLTLQEPAPTAVAVTARSRTAAEISIKETVAEASIPRPKPGLTPLATPDKPQPPRDVPPPVRVNSRKGVWIGLTLALIVVTVTGVLILVRPATNNDRFADLMNKTMTPEQRQAEAEKDRIFREQAENDRRAKEKRNNEEKLAANEAARKKVNDDQMAAAKLAADQQAERARLEMEKSQDEARREAALKAEGPFAFIKNDPNFRDEHNQWLFRLPELNSSAPGKPIPLRLLKGQEPKDVKLSLCHAAAPLFAKCPVKLEIDEAVGDPKVWTATAGGIELAKYTLERIHLQDRPDGDANYQITFQWADGVQREPTAEILRWWPLQIDVADQFAVLMQRTAFRPTTPVTWSDLSQNQLYQFPVGSEIQVLNLDEHLGLVFEMQFLQEGIDAVTLTLPLSRKETESLPGEEDKGERNDQEENNYFFLLEQPFQTISKLPDDMSSLIVFGTLLISPHIEGSSGIGFRSNISIHARIPRKEHISTLPSPKLIAGLEKLVVDPTLFFREVAGVINDENNAAKGWPLLKSRYDDAMADMDETVQAFQSSVDFWHSQKLQRLPGKKEFTSQFRRKATGVLKEVNGVIPKLSQAAQMQRTNSAQQDFKKAQEYASAISMYDRLLKNAIDEVDVKISVLLKDYDAIGMKISKFEEASAAFRIRCSLFRSIETPKAESGEKVNIYVMESDSVASP